MNFENNAIGDSIYKNVLADADTNPPQESGSQSSPQNSSAPINEEHSQIMSDIIKEDVPQIGAPTDIGGGSGGGAPIPEPQMPSPSQKPPKISKNLITFLIGVIFIAGALFLILPAFRQSQQVNITTTSIVPTTIQQNLEKCFNITSPGVYILSKDIDTNDVAPCITITANNVKLLGNGRKIMGHGPFLNISPFSYGVYVSNSRNVTIENLEISNFSYGVYIENSRDVTVNANLVYNVVAGLFAKNSKYIALNGNVTDTTLSGINLKNVTYCNINGTIIRNSKEDLRCDYYSGRISLSNSSFTGGCWNSTGCEFAFCKNTKPVEFPTLYFNIDGCGDISISGTYFLLNDIDVSKITRFNKTCIRVLANNVVLDMNGHAIKGNRISNGFELVNVHNVTIKNGAVTYHNNGVKLVGSSNVNFDDLNISYNNIGLLLSNSNGNRFTKVKTQNNIVGVLMTNAIGNTFSGFNSLNNTQGFFVSNYSVGNFFQHGSANDRQYAFYCDAKSSDSKLNTYFNTSCNIGTCQWASCKKMVLPAGVFSNISSCRVISEPGNYSLKNNLVTTSSCLRLSSDNITLDCRGFSITGNNIGNGIEILGKNVNLMNCRVSNFDKSIVAKNSKNISIQSTSFDSIYLTNISKSMFQNISGKELVLNSSTNNVFYNSSIARGVIYSSNSNFIYFTKFSSLNFSANSTGNRIENGKVDSLLCDKSTSGILKNYAVLPCSYKTCDWAVCTSVQPIPCKLLTGYELFVSDYVISSPTCFTVLSNDSVIDCNYHTILGKGNVFAYVNAARFKLLNCKLVNFSSVVVAKGKSMTFENLIIGNSINSIIGNITNSIFRNIQLWNTKNVSVIGSGNGFYNITMR